MTVTKEDIVEQVAGIGFTRKKSIELVESLLEIMKASLERGEELLISGFGKFYVRRKAQRMGRNPKTGVEAVVQERSVVRFRCSPVLRDRMNAVD
jgi:integration host factor subunit alpha